MCILLAPGQTQPSSRGERSRLARSSHPLVPPASPARPSPARPHLAPPPPRLALPRSPASHPSPSPRPSPKRCRWFVVGAADGSLYCPRRIECSQLRTAVPIGSIVTSGSHPSVTESRVGLSIRRRRQRTIGNAGTLYSLTRVGRVSRTHVSR